MENQTREQWLAGCGADYAPPSERERFISGLRDLATFLESHSDVPFPSDETLNAFTDKEGVTRAARAASWEKNYGQDYFWLSKSFGGINLHVNTERQSVCRKVVKGMKTIPARPEQEVEDVEWVCDEALLAGGDA